MRLAAPVMGQAGQWCSGGTPCSYPCRAAGLRAPHCLCSAWGMWLGLGSSVPAGTPLGALRCCVGEMQILLFWRAFKQLLALTGLKPAAFWGRLSLLQGQ